MDDTTAELAFLRKELYTKEEEVSKLMARIKKLEAENIIHNWQTPDNRPEHLTSEFSFRCELENNDIARFSRQIILSEIGVQGQLKLKSSAVLIVGAGGLGCPSALYLAAAGIGRLGFVDYDEVDQSNLHRQVLHTEADFGKRKVSSASEAIKRYDVIIDASDNVATRYLLNDACVIAKKPLVSGSALKWEGQLTVYNFDGGPCYRCIFPKPPPPNTVTNCSEGGIVGAVTGTIGCVQALEALKIIVRSQSSYKQRLLLLDALEGGFRTVKLRNRRPDCQVCGDNPTITELQDYVQFCGAAATDKEKALSLLKEEDRISVDIEDRATWLHQIMQGKTNHHVLVDVRTPEEYEICSLKGSINVPISTFEDDSNEKLDTFLRKTEAKHENLHMYVICRRGNDSQRAVQKLKEKVSFSVQDVKGGLHAWNRHIDSTFPYY